MTAHDPQQQFDVTEVAMCDAGHMNEVEFLACSCCDRAVGTCPECDVEIVLRRVAA